MTNIDLDRLQNELLSLSEFAVNKALKKGAREAEALISAEDNVSASITKSGVDASRGAPSGAGIRVVLEGKTGFAATTGISRDRISSVIEEAMTIAEIRPADPNFKHLPDPVKLVSKDGLIDKGIVDFPEDEALKSLKECAKRALEYDKRIASFYTDLHINRACLAVSNSRGIEATTKTAYLKVSARCTAAEAGKQKTGSDHIVSRKAEDFGELGAHAAENALKMLGARQLNATLRTRVLWENTAIADLFKCILDSAVNANNVLDGGSHYKDKIGKEVASRDLTIIDDGQLPEGLQTSRIDGEGIPRRATTIIDKGVLRGYIYNSYSALRANTESTGNATRDYPEPYLQLPDASMTNIVVKPGKKKADELIAETAEGILITDKVIGAELSNLTTGDFSVVAPNAYLIRKGEVLHPLESLSIAGNFFNALEKVQQIGSDVRLLSEGMIPSMILEDLTVSG